MGDTMTVMRFEADGRALRVDFGKPVSIAIPLDFAGPQPAAFGAPRAESRPLRVGGFVGDMRAGGSCNCEVLTLAPHCNGTHTECVGHVTDARVAIAERLPGGVQLALLVTVEPAPAEHSGEDTDPRPAPGDRLVTAAALERAAVRHAGPRPAALIASTGGPRRRPTCRARPRHGWSSGASRRSCSTCPPPIAPTTADG
jgi:hypothetical protein